MSKTYVSKADFLAGIMLKPQDLEVDGLGTVQVRGLTLREMGELRDKYQDNEIALMVHGAHRGLVNPLLSEEEIEALYTGDPSLILPIGQRVFQLSGRGNSDAQDPLAGNGSSPPKVTELQ